MPSPQAAQSQRAPWIASSAVAAATQSKAEPYPQKDFCPGASAPGPVQNEHITGFRSLAATVPTAAMHRMTPRKGRTPAVQNRSLREKLLSDTFRAVTSSRVVAAAITATVTITPATRPGSSASTVVPPVTFWMPFTTLSCLSTVK